MCAESQPTDINQILTAVKDDWRELAVSTKTPLSIMLPDAANQSASGAETPQKGLFDKARDRINRFSPALAVMIVKAGGLRLHQLIGGDMELAYRNQAHKTLRANHSSGIRAYRRVLTGRENCALCVVASTQRYWVEDLLPIHPGCDCSVQPLPPGMENQQVIDPDLLDRAHAAVEDRYGSYAPDARAIDYREIILVSDHGEYGPVMGWKETVSQRRSRLFKPPKWNAKAPKGTIIPSNESRKLTITEEFCLKVYYGINGKGGHAYGMSPIGELAKSINTEFPKPWTLEDVIYAIEQTRDHPDIEYAGKASWRHLRKNVNGVICELRYSYAKKHDKATPRIFIPLSGTIEKDGKIYHVRMRDKSGYHDIPLHHPDLDASGIIDI